MRRGVKDAAKHIRLNAVIIVNELHIPALGQVHQGISFPAQHHLFIVIEDQNLNAIAIVQSE